MLVPELPWAALVLDLDAQARRALARADDEAAPGPARVAVENRVGDDLGQARHRIRGGGAVAQDLDEEPAGLPPPVRAGPGGTGAGARAGYPPCPARGAHPPALAPGPPLPPPCP